jgi:hypothetical protein
MAATRLAARVMRRMSLIVRDNTDEGLMCDKKRRLMKNRSLSDWLGEAGPQEKETSLTSYIKITNPIAAQSLTGNLGMTVW